MLSAYQLEYELFNADNTPAYYARTGAVDMPTVIKAKELRRKDRLDEVPDSKPGWYRWWAPDHVVRLLLGNNHSDLVRHLTRGKGKLSGLLYVYVGTAAKNSLQARLNWHVNQAHTASSIKSGALSTLRQTIASLAGSSQADQNATNAIMDEMFIEYFPSNMPIGRQAVDALEAIEDTEMRNNALVLNIKKNMNPLVTSFITHLSRRRRLAREAALRPRENVDTQPSHATLRPEWHNHMTTLLSKITVAEGIKHQKF